VENRCCSEHQHSDHVELTMAEIPRLIPRTKPTPPDESDATGAFGPMFVSVDELPPGASGLRLTTKIGNDVMQDGNTADMFSGVGETIAIVGAAITLEPGDMLVKGTPGGVGFARKPPVFLPPGDTVTVTIEGNGELVSDVVDEWQP
jgi:acylpyruvate hydrolase